MFLDSDRCFRALLARDARFDGVFFVGVSTTGVYCRPVCKARTPGRDRCSFHRTAAEAERAGFRACFRCRPEVAPGAGHDDALPRLVSGAVRLIDRGFLNERSVDALARRFGVTSRHLRRSMETTIGVTPVELAQTRRLALAKQLLHDTRLPLAEIAFASGFGSVRRFNALFADRFGRNPGTIRREQGGAGDSALTLRLDFRAPFAWEHLLAFLRARAIPGVERVEGGEYRRTVRIGRASGTIAVRRAEARDALLARVSASLAGSLMEIAARVRGVFDLDARPLVVAEALGRDRVLAASVRRVPGLRVPGAFDGFECAVRAVLGQQVSVAGATTLAGRFAERFGTPVRSATDDGLARTFPDAARVASAGAREVAAIGIPRARAEALLAVARAIAEGRVRLDRGTDPEAVTAALCELPGIGPWTASYLAMRALGWPDAFPAGDLGFRNALGLGSEREIERRAETWRPWRAYAAMHLWNTLSLEER